VNDGEAQPTDVEPTEPEVPQPPWVRSRPRRTRAPLSQEAIVDAALRVLDREGAAGLSMRRIGEELGSGAGALYWHVENKEQLVQLLFDRVIGELPLTEIDPANWREQVKQAARDVREAMNRHPGIAQLSFGRIPLGPNAIRYFEWQLSLLRAGGLPDRVAALAGDLLALYIDAFSYEECVEAPFASDEGGASFIAEIRTYLESLPPDRFPNLTQLAEPLMSGSRDERFEFGLEILVDGLAAHAKHS
jgi:AcrR family transcriptional regulator